ncbi:hypothetical protein FY528_11430 [Hymenobacter lutimineralis]|uniref:PorT family protein n=1 Tax=Hymenobacter lutimineralis TaxID=2606448 RepID=A0A5D6V3F1_9BACT|nr:hypothetical protein [Hymenobacter lutimineralis]TYZ09349.1 hypothetical protein FY528_11430 [Hymenobacter lutimineralis]
MPSSFSPTPSTKPAYSPQLGFANEQDSNGTDLYNYSYNSLDYGLAAGIEARVGPARVGGRYTAGFNEIIKDPKAGISQSITDIKNGAFQVYVGIGITN